MGLQIALLLTCALSRFPGSLFPPPPGVPGFPVPPAPVPWFPGSPLPGSPVPRFPASRVSGAPLPRSPDPFSPLSPVPVPRVPGPRIPGFPGPGSNALSLLPLFPGSRLPAPRFPRSLVPTVFGVECLVAPAPYSSVPGSLVPRPPGPRFADSMFPGALRIAAKVPGTMLRPRAAPPKTQPKVHEVPL